MITIPQPCHEDWEKMRVVNSTRRHCASCEKTLVDFSLMSDDEIASYLRYNNKNLCGRFSKAQLNRRIAQIPEPRMQPRWKMWLLFPLTLIGKILSAQGGAQQDTTPPVDTTSFVTANDTTPALDSTVAESDSTIVNDTSMNVDSTVAVVDTLTPIDTATLVVDFNPDQYRFIWAPYQGPVLVYPIVSTGMVQVVFGDICVLPAPPAPTSPFDLNMTSPPPGKPDMVYLNAGVRFPPILPKEKPKDDPTPPPVPSMPWYSVLIPVPFRRKKSKHEK